jgi:micrococcal nuclease
MSVLCKLFAVGCALITSQGNTISGPATVQDGDTIYVQHQAVRLLGVDAEELSEPHGVRAKLALRQIIGDAVITCVLGGTSYSRSVGRCYSPSGAELNQAIVASGWALDCKRYSGGRYRGDEAPGARAKLLQKAYC